MFCPPARDGSVSPMAMFQSDVPMAERTVGVLHRDDEKVMKGYVLICSGKETFLLDEDGRVVHEWRSRRAVFVAHLLPNGNLLRDGSENLEAPCFKAGGAAGFLEMVSWDNEVIWEYNVLPYSQFLTHHDLHPLPNGNVLLLSWERKSKEQAIKAGRRPDLIPDGEVWDNLVLEIAPDGEGSANIVWRWSMWDHLVQDFDETKENYGDVRAHPELMDINYCPPGGKNGLRNRSLLQNEKAPNPSQLANFGASAGKTGEKDWLHVNGLSWDPERDQILLSMNILCEIFVIDHATSNEEARGHAGGRRGKGGDLLYRFGNPQVARFGSCSEQQLFCQHSAHFLRGVPGEGNFLVFNNGRAPDRHWSSADEFTLPDTDGDWPEMKRGAPSSKLVWKFGPPIGRQGSFYCTHISGCQRLANGNTLVTQGPQGILVEVTPDGQEAWRYVSPAFRTEAGVGFVRQGDQRVSGAFSLFRAIKHPVDYPAFASRDLPPRRFLEA